MIPPPVLLIFFLYISFSAGLVIHLFENAPITKWTKKAPSKEARTVFHIIAVLTGPIWLMWLFWCIFRYLGKGVYDLVRHVGKGIHDLIPRRAAKITVPRAIVVDTDRKQV